MKILILKPSSLGDVVQALPVLRLLRRRFPQAAIYWWLDSRSIPLFDQDPDLTAVIPFRRQEWSQPRAWPALLGQLRGLRALHFDWVLDLQALLRSALVGWWVRADLRVGLDDPREGAPAFYDLRVPRPHRLAHAVDWYVAVLRELDVPVSWDFEWLPPRPEVQQAMARRWPGRADRRWILLHPGARWATKRWPERSWAELAQRLAREHPAHTLAVIGSAGAPGLASAIGSLGADRCLDLSGSTSLPELIEWIRGADLMITNDTGPMHVAAALRTPVLGLFGPTEPLRTGAYGQVRESSLQRKDLPCIPCLRSECRYPEPMACLEGLSAERVAAAARRRLEGQSASGD